MKTSQHLYNLKFFQMALPVFVGSLGVQFDRISYQSTGTLIKPFNLIVF